MVKHSARTGGHEHRAQEFQGADVTALLSTV
jgi:hypothetical protein